MCVHMLRARLAPESVRFFDVSPLQRVCSTLVPRSARARPFLTAKTLSSHSRRVASPPPPPYRVICIIGGCDGGVVSSQIQEEFNNGVPPGRQPSSSSSSAAAAAASPSAPSGAGSAVPRWPFNAAGIGRPHPEGASPGQAGRGRDGNNAGRGIVKVSPAGKAVDRRRRAAEDADERRRAEALARRREFRGECACCAAVSGAGCLF